VSIASGVIGGKDAIEALVERLREAFGMTSVALVENGVIVSVSADEATAAPTDEETTLPLGTTAELRLRGKTLAASDRKILGAFVSQLESALERRRLTAEAEGIAPLAAADRLRSALLAAVGHDLLDVSRLQAGVLGVTLEPVSLKEVLGDVVDELRLAPGAVQLDLGEVQAISADPALLQRVLVNLLANALRYSPAGSPPVVTTSEFGDRVQIRVIDRGPGIPSARREEVFLPFQRLGDTDNTAGIGLGLALAKGFVEGMGGTLEAEDTPGGGLTMVVELGVAA
jgi:two-component system sensor histidine kinase KdpD